MLPFTEEVARRVADAVDAENEFPAPIIYGPEWE